jgi:hypothetical protein
MHLQLPHFIKRYHKFLLVLLAVAGSEFQTWAVAQTAPDVSAVAATRSDDPPRIPRAEAFFGFHFDLHPNAQDTALGRDLTDDMVQRLLARTHPDYIQYDSRGGPGYLGWPNSKTGTSAPGIVKDSLAIWRRVTRKNGVALGVHFIACENPLVLATRPDLARIDSQGKPDPTLFSLFSPFADEVNIPELKEVISRYDLDSVWLDSEAVTPQPDYCAAAATAFHTATGMAQLPLGPNDPGWNEFLELNREQFRKYLAHCRVEIGKEYPHVELISNWAYSMMMPEKPVPPVNYASSDYLDNLEGSMIASADGLSRYYAASGLPWDMMLWSFDSRHQDKSVVQMEQEAAVIMAQGGGVCTYYQPTRAGWIDDRYIASMGLLADFCRARQKLCHKSQTVPQIGVLFSKNSFYKSSNSVFGAWSNPELQPFIGLTDALIDSHDSVDIIPDWKLQEVMADYPMIVVPAWHDIGAPTRDALVQYAQAGGVLLIDGVENAALFGQQTGVDLVGAPRPQGAYIPGAEVFGHVEGIWQDVRPRAARVLEMRYPEYTSARDGVPAATLSPCGKGRILAIYGSLGGSYYQSHAAPIREVIEQIVNAAFRPMVHVKGPSTIEVVLRTKNSTLLVNLINRSGGRNSQNYELGDAAAPVGSLQIEVTTKKAPVRVTLYPDGSKLEWSRKNDIDRLTLPKLDVHQIVALEFAP